jgi:phospholipid/cholesterol/gamma-HCH transport system substrate-binding protein
METRARYALIGLFMFAVILASFGFVYWLENKGGFGERETYLIQFESSVSGLLVGSAVLFNGIRVGDVTNVALNPDEPQQVIATIAVNRNTPVREDTRVNVESQGLTGGIAVTLTGGLSNTPLPSDGNAPPTLIAPPGVGQDWTQSARDAFQEVQGVVAQNAEPLNEAIVNIEVFTEALARNADKVDGILAGIERMTGGSADKSKTPLYSLAVATDLPAPPEHTPNWQLLVPEPSTLMGFNTDKILTQPRPDESLPLENAEWSDNLPVLVQAKVLQTFENAGYARSVSGSRDGFANNYELLINIRNFHVSTQDGAQAEIGFLARLQDQNGEIIASKLFKGSKTANGTDARAYVDALSEVFGKLQLELLEWTTAALDAAPMPAVTVEPPADIGEMPADPEDPQAP